MEEDRDDRFSRRSLVARGGAATAALAPLTLAGGALAGTAAAAPAARPAGGTVQDATQFFTDVNFNFETLFAIGSAGYGAGEYGEVATVINQVHADGDTYDAIYNRFFAMATRVAGNGAAALRRGDTASARGAYLRAAKYLTIPLYFVLGTSRPTKAREQLTYRTMEKYWAQAARLFDPPFEPVRIPYGNTTLPGWFLRPPGPRVRRPTVLINNGNDAQNVDLWVYGGAAALERGWNALIFEGPGQGSMWFLRRIPFRPDWEKVITPIVDFVLRRNDVDPRRIALTGWSQGGELVPRAAAFEHRLRALVPDPGVVDVIKAFRIPAEITALANSGQRAATNAAFDAYIAEIPQQYQFAIRKGTEPFGQPDWYSTIRYLERFTVRDVARRITARTLVMDYDQEQFFPGQPRQLYSLLRAPKEYRKLTAAEGAQLHDAPMAPQRRNQVVFEFLARALDVREGSFTG